MAITAKKISKPKKKAAPARSAAERILAIARKHSSRIPPEDWKDVPADLAKNVDHYLYGHPKEK
jgi:hypothetical protein